MSLEKGTVGRLRWLREGANVERAHTVPHHGTYTVGQHSHGVAMIIVALHPDPSAQLLKAALTHDLHEFHTGDVMPWAKTGEFLQMEIRAQALLGIDFEITKEEDAWLRAADLLDLLFWAREQQAVGNRNVDRIHDQVYGYFTTVSCDAPAPIREAALEYKATASWPIGAKK